MITAFADSETALCAETGKPIIKLKGAAIMSVAYGAVWVDPGVNAWDPEDGDLTSSVVTTGDNVDVNVPGDYYIVYSATDSAGNKSTVTRKVIVEQKIVTAIEIDPIVDPEGPNGDPDEDDVVLIPKDTTLPPNPFSIVDPPGTGPEEDPPPADPTPDPDTDPDTDTDSDGTPDVTDTDDDDDGLTDEEEAAAGTDPLDSDSDDDGLPDSVDPTPLGDSDPGPVPDMDDDGIPDSSDLDLDGDGTLNPVDPDVDGDGLLNEDDPDDDDDGIEDQWDSTPRGPGSGFGDPLSNPVGGGRPGVVGRYLDPRIFIPTDDDGNVLPGGPQTNTDLTEDELKEILRSLLTAEGGIPEELFLDDPPSTATAGDIMGLASQVLNPDGSFGDRKITILKVVEGAGVLPQLREIIPSTSGVTNAYPNNVKIFEITDEFSLKGNRPTVIEIDGAESSGPNTFRWSSDGGTIWKNANLPIVVGKLYGLDGIRIGFDNATGNVKGNSWTFNNVQYVPKGSSWVPPGVSSYTATDAADADISSSITQTIVDTLSTAYTIDAEVWDQASCTAASDEDCPVGKFFTLTTTATDGNDNTRSQVKKFLVVEGEPYVYPTTGRTSLAVTKANLPIADDWFAGARGSWISTSGGPDQLIEDPAGVSDVTSDLVITNYFIEPGDRAGTQVQNIGDQGFGDYVQEASTGGSGNASVGQRTITVVEKDEDAPTFDLGSYTNPRGWGFNDVTIPENSRFAPETPEARDAVDGDLTSSVKLVTEIESDGGTWGEVPRLNTAKPGRYRLTYTVEDSSSNIATFTRYITVDEGSAVDPSPDAATYPQIGSQGQRLAVEVDPNETGVGTGILGESVTVSGFELANARDINGTYRNEGTLGTRDYWKQVAGEEYLFYDPIEKRWVFNDELGTAAYGSQGGTMSNVVEGYGLGDATKPWLVPTWTDASGNVVKGETDPPTPSSSTPITKEEFARITNTTTGNANLTQNYEAWKAWDASDDGPETGDAASVAAWIAAGAPGGTGAGTTAAGTKLTKEEFAVLIGMDPDSSELDAFYASWESWDAFHPDVTGAASVGAWLEAIQASKNEKVEDPPITLEEFAKALGLPVDENTKELYGKWRLWDKNNRPGTGKFPDSVGTFMTKLDLSDLPVPNPPPTPRGNREPTPSSTYVGWTAPSKFKGYVFDELSNSLSGPFSHGNLTAVTSVKNTSSLVGVTLDKKVVKTDLKDFKEGDFSHPGVEVWPLLTEKPAHDDFIVASSGGSFNYRGRTLTSPFAEPETGSSDVVRPLFFEYAYLSIAETAWMHLGDEHNEKQIHRVDLSFAKYSAGHVWCYVQNEDGIVKGQYKGDIEEHVKIFANMRGRRFRVRLFVATHKSYPWNLREMSMGYLLGKSF